MIPVRDQEFSTTDVARRAGVSFRQLDYWDRVGVLCPSVAESKGSGSQRRYSTLDVRIAAVLGAATCCGMSREHMTRLVETLRGDADAWDMSLIVTCDGRVQSTEAPGSLLDVIGVGACWLVNPAAAAADTGLDP